MFCWARNLHIALCDSNQFVEIDDSEQLCRTHNVSKAEKILSRLLSIGGRLSRTTQELPNVVYSLIGKFVKNSNLYISSSVYADFWSRSLRFSKWTRMLSEQGINPRAWGIFINPNIRICTTYCRTLRSLRYVTSWKKKHVKIINVIDKRKTIHAFFKIHPRYTRYWWLLGWFSARIPTQCLYTMRFGMEDCFDIDTISYWPNILQQLRDFVDRLWERVLWGNVSLCHLLCGRDRGSIWREDIWNLSKSIWSIEKKGIY